MLFNMLCDNVLCKMLYDVLYVYAWMMFIQVILHSGFSGHRKLGFCGHQNYVLWAEKSGVWGNELKSVVPKALG